MKKLFVTLIALALGTAVQAQGIDFGIKAGANFASLSDMSGAKNRTGLHAGVFLGLKFNDNIALQPELLYSQQGADFSVGSVDLDYINVPVVVKYYLIQGLNLQLGPQFGFVVNDNVSNAITEAESFDFSAVLGAGFDLPMGVRIDARYNLGFTKVVKGSDAKNGVFSLAVGYSFL